MSKPPKKDLFSSNQLFKTIVESGSDMVLVSDFEMNIIYSNPSTSRSIGFKPTDFQSLIAEDDFTDFNKVFKLAVEGLLSAESNFRTRIQTKVGTPINISFNLSNYQEDGAEKYLIFDCRVIDDLITYESSLKRMQAILNGIAKASMKLNERGGFDEKIEDSLKEVGDALQAQRIRFFRNSQFENELFTQLDFEWPKPNKQGELSNELVPTQKLQQLLPEIEKQRPFFFYKEEAQEDLTKLFSHDCQTILFLPIFHNAAFWGFIVFENCQKEESWSDNELAVLSGYSANLDSALSRDSYQKRLSEVASLTTLNPSPIVRINRKGAVLISNEASERLQNPTIIGIDDETAVPWLNYVCNSVNNTNRTLQFEITENRRHYTVEAILSEDEKHINIYLADISSQKIAERSLVRATENLTLFKQLIDYSSDAVQVMTEDGNLFYLNTEASDRLAIAPNEIKKYSILDIESNFQSIEEWKVHVEEMKKTDSFTTEGVNVNQKTGDNIDVEVSVKYLRLSNTGYMVAIIRDISERKHRETQLRIQEEKYRNIISNMNLGLLEVDTEDNILYCNKSFEAISGYDLSELEGRNGSEVFLSEDNAKIMSEKNKLRLTEKSDSYEILARTKGGENRWWLISGAPNYNDEGEIIGSIGIHLDITEDKNLQMKLAEERQRLNYVIKGTNKGTWELDVTSMDRKLANGWTHILGMEDTDEFLVTQAEWKNWIHPDDLKEESEQLKSHLAGKTEFFHAELRMKHVKGDWVWVELNGKILENDNSKEARMYGTAKDITSSKELENQLKFNAEKFQSIYDLSPVGIALNDLETGEFLELNSALVKPTGYTREEFLKLSYFDITPEKYTAIETQMVEKLKEGGRYGPYEKEYIRKNGERYPVLLNGVLFKDVRNREVILSTVQDISESKKYEHQLKTQQSALRSLNEINALSHMSFKEQIHEALKLGAEFLNMEMAIISKINLDDNSYEVIHQYSNENQLSDGLKFPLEQTYCDITIKKMDLVAIANMSASEYNAHPCYNSFNLESYIGIPFIVDDELFGTINFSSPKPRSESFLKSEIEFIRLLGRWVNSVMERNSFIETLEISKKIAEEESVAKESFLTNMSHEIRTPLNGILGMMRELGRESVSEKQANYIDRAKRASEHLLEIVNNILDISKIEAQELILEKINFDLPDLLQDVKEILNSTATDRDNQIKIDLQNDLSRYFSGDAARLRQVLLNLAGNSVKFTENGIITLRARVLKDYQNHQNIEIEVLDTGVGIEAKYLKNIFNKFQQEDSSISRRYGGTGLGMVITKEIVELMGGEIHIASTKGKGTSVKLNLNLRKASSSDYGVAQNKIEIGELQKPLRVLLVEDNELNRLVAANSLALISAEVTEAENGLLALEILEKNEFDLILMDIQMPVMDGIEATKNIREKMHIKTPIIALSANAFRSEIDVSEKIGMNDYLTKPFQEQEFLKKVLEHTQQQNKIERKTSEDKEKSATSNSLYSLKVIEEMSRGNKDFVLKMSTIFIDQVKETQNEIRDALNQNDLKKVAKLVHRIKPSILNMEINELRGDIAFLEKLDADSNFAFVKDKVTTFFNVLEEVVGDLTAKGLYSK